MVFKLNKISIAVEHFEKCSVAMLGGPCSQHTKGNASRLNQPQGAIIFDIRFFFFSRKKNIFAEFLAIIFACFGFFEVFMAFFNML